MPNTDRFSMLERWANGAEAFRDAMETQYGPAPTPPQLPQYTIYDAMLEAIADNTVGVKRLLNKKSPTYHSDSVAYVKTVPSGDVHYASLDSIGGKTLVWNQLMNHVATAEVSYESNGITYTVKTDGSIRIQGQATALSTYIVPITVFARVPTVQNHVYYKTPLPNGTTWSDTSNRLGAGTGIVTATITSSANQLYFRVQSTSIAYDVTIYPMLIDLTLMFGAGNEPSIVDEVEKMLPNPPYSYNAGTLLSAGVTEVVSVGKNLADFSGGRGYPSNTGFSNATKRTFTIGKYVLGLSNNNYYQTTQVTSHTVTDNSITITSSNTGYGCSIPFLCKPSTAYAFSCTTTDGKYTVSWYTEDGTWISNSANYTTSFSATSPANAYCGLLSLIVATNGVTATFTNIQIEQSATATPYSAPFTISTPIPAEIQALEGYGWSAGSVYNYIDFERKVFVQRVAKVDLGTFSWTRDDTSYSYAFFNSGVLNTKKAGSVNMVTENYVASSGGRNTLTTDKMIAPYNISNSKAICVRDDIYSDSATFASAVNGKYLYYELETPIETDISAYITDDNLIEVEAGGSLTFPNANGDDYRIPVPSSETFIVGEP